eukprot:SRR837773.2902.p2 GENE.SRR837773.2902~~SRR837773.2902.p2  ORF type:complete len:289 (+),score=129.22 SRR837773.2902:64-930(+)
MGRTLASKAAVLLLAFSAPLALADRDQVSRKGRRTGAVTPSALVALDEESPAVPDTAQVDAAEKVVDTKLTEVGGAITNANEKARAAMTGAVNWKETSAKIPELIAQVHEDAKNKIWTKLQNVAPMIGGAEKQSMADLLKNIVADVSKQKTDGDAEMQPTVEALNKVLEGLHETAQKNHAGEVTESDKDGAPARGGGGGDALVQGEAQQAPQAPQVDQKDLLAALTEASKTSKGQEMLAALVQAMDTSNGQPAAQAPVAAVEVDASGVVPPVQVPLDQVQAAPEQPQQ